METDGAREAANQVAGEIGRLLAGLLGGTDASGVAKSSGTTSTLIGGTVHPAQTVDGAPAGAPIGNAAMSLLPSAVRFIQPVLHATMPQSSPGSWLRWLNPFASLIGLFAGLRDEPGVEASPIEAQGLPTMSYQRGVRQENSWRPEEIDFAADGRVRPVPSAAPSVIVQVQAMDSRSFLDHSDAIADAVRKSLLESHSLAETVREL